MDQLSETAVKAIADLAIQADFGIDIITTPTDVSGLPKEVPVLIDPKTGKAASIKQLVDEWRLTPARKSGTAKVLTLESFTELVDRHKTEHSVIFADTDWTEPSLTAVIDYHAKVNGGLADNGKHRIHYDFPLSDSWKAWIGINSKALDQTQFAEFIEDHIADLAAPDEIEEEDWRHKFSFRVAHPNELVTLSRGLQVASEMKVKNVVSLQSGAAQINFEEEHRDANGNKLDVPGMFILSVPPFFRGEPTRIPVRLRYRLSSGKLLWICQLYRPDVHITEQVVRDMERAGADTGLPYFQGAPEMQA
ncbi:DUF2303 family protein [Rhizobium leguminosarum]|nr:DUF2303 family protein [Rhizobium leguminosarum]